MTVSIGKIRGGSGISYLIGAVARGSEDYYTGSGEAAGQWLGSGSAALGLEGEVDPEAFARVLRGLDPATGEPLRANEASVPGFDVTFSPVKSISVLWGLGDQAVRETVRQAHDEAVREAVEWLEEAACVVRRGHAGAVREPGGGFVAAAFRHRTSRAGDPQLHTHVAIANMAQGSDQRWTALEAGRLYAMARAASALYGASLRARLTGDLGVTWEPDPEHRGRDELAGIDPELLTLFSKRRQEVEAKMAERGESGPRAAQVAVLDTRRAKPAHTEEPAEHAEWSSEARDYGLTPTPTPGLYDRWSEEARTHGLTLDLASITHRVEAERVTDQEIDECVEFLTSPRGLTAERTAVRWQDIVQAGAERLPAGRATLDDALRVAERVSEHEEVVFLGATLGGDKLFTTRELLAKEQSVVEDARARAEAGVAVVEGEVVAGVLGARPTISDEQRAMVERLTTSGAGVEVVVGRAGTGKTFALAAAREAWQASGAPVLGACLAARAARNLEDEAGIRSSTVASIVGDLRRGEELPRGVVLVVDEAGMVGTRDLAFLDKAVAAANGKLVLVGDHRQLSEVKAAGGLLSRLRDELGATELTEVRRQEDEGERQALDELREGDAEKWVSWAREQGRVTLVDRPEQLHEAMVSDWWQDRDDALLLARRKVDVRALNELARAKMREAGLLGDEELTVGPTPRARASATARLKAAEARRSFAVGDRLVCLRNRPDLHVSNGTLGTVVSIDHAGGSISIRTDAGEEITLPQDYLRRKGTVDHGYALTGHKSQGQTSRRTVVAIDPSAEREWSYVVASRARGATRVYAVDPGPDPELEHHVALDERLDPLLQATARRGAQVAASSRFTRGGVARAAAVREAASTLTLGEIDAELRALRSKLRRVEARGAERARVGHEQEELAERVRVLTRARARRIERRAAALVAAGDRRLGARPEGLAERRAWERKARELAEREELGREARREQGWEQRVG
ncbi:MAG: relaxase domain-containing protein [Actinomycetota bacterium]|nr:relaxase domain-containing protein [Actinomycetota bacterium]